MSRPPETTLMQDSASRYGARQQRLRTVAQICALGIAFEGMLVLAGWLFEIPALARLGTRFAMAPSAGLGFLFAGASLWFVSAPTGRWSGKAGLACALVTALLGGLTGLEYVFGIDLPIDQLIATDVSGLILTEFPGRMAAVASILMTLLGAALGLLHWGKRYGVAAGQALAACVFVGALTALYGFVYAESVEAVQAVHLFKGVAVHTVVGFLVASVGILCAPAGSGFLRVLIAPGTGGAMARGVLPWAVVVPPVLGWLRLEGQEVGLYGTEFGIALLVTSTVTIFVGLLLVTSNTMERVDRNRIAAETATRESETRYRSLFDGMPVGLIRSGPDGRIYEANAAAVRLMGLESREALLGANAASLYVDPQDRERFRRLAEESEAVTGFETRLKRADGTHFWARFNSRIVREATGATHYESSVEDITSLRQAQQRVTRMAAIVESSEDAIYSKSLEGIVTSWNAGAERIYGYTAGEIIGNSAALLLPAGRLDELPSILNEIREGRSVANFETVRQAKDGRRIDISLSVAPLRDESGKVVGASSIARDVTGRNRAEAEIRLLNATLEQRVTERTAALESANRELEAFVYSVSHDLRAPLRSIDGFSRILQEDYAERVDQDGRDSLHRVRAAAQKMGHLIDDMLKLSRLSRAEMNSESVDLAALAQGIFDELRAEHPARAVTFKTTPGLQAWGDRTLLAVLLQNLLGNAWKFSSRHPSALIELGAAEKDGETVYFVRDDGAGFDMAHVAALFAPFQRLHAMNEFPGTGIGLATVRRVVQRHGGRAWAEGAVEKGATFYFALPAPEAAVRAEERAVALA